MARLRYVLDMGSAYTYIYNKNGVVLKEPTIALIRKDKSLELLAAGSEAYPHVGKIDKNTDFISPVKDGAVEYGEAATLMLKSFFDRVIAKSFFNTVEIIAAIPAGLNHMEREAYEECIIKTGYANVALVESVIGLTPVVHKAGQLVMVIGSGNTEIGVVSREGIVAACSLNIGGRDLDEKIAECVLYEHNARISMSTAESLKTELGSLYEGDLSSAEVVARDLFDNHLKKIQVTAETIRAPILKCYATIVEVAESLLTTIPASLFTDVSARGIYLAGGGAQMAGLADYIRKELMVPVILDPEPEIAVARGLFNY